MVKFPYRDLTKEDALKDYLNLKKLPEKLTLDRTRIGNKATDYYFQRARSKAKLKNRKSHLDAWNNPEERRKTIEFAKRWRQTTNPTLGDLRAAVRFRFGSINQFKPAVARFIYQKFKPKRVLDFTAGWGGRLLGAMSLDIDYIGIDSNRQLKEPYRRMISDFPSKSDVKMFYTRSENFDYSKLPEYDMIFTSPPYFDLEIYPSMKVYKDNQDFLDSFFEPVVRKAFKHLKKNGHLILNIPAEMKDALKSFNLCRGKISNIKMPISNRFNDGTERFELIYVCNK